MRSSAYFLFCLFHPFTAISMEIVEYHNSHSKYILMNIFLFIPCYCSPPSMKMARNCEKGNYMHNACIREHRTTYNERRKKTKLCALRTYIYTYTRHRQTMRVRWHTMSATRKRGAHHHAFTREIMRHC